MHNQINKANVHCEHDTALLKNVMHAAHDVAHGYRVVRATGCLLFQWTFMLNFVAGCEFRKNQMTWFIPWKCKFIANADMKKINRDHEKAFRCVLPEENHASTSKAQLLRKPSRWLVWARQTTPTKKTGTNSNNGFARARQGKISRTSHEQDNFQVHQEATRWRAAEYKRAHTYSWNCQQSWCLCCRFTRARDCTGSCSRGEGNVHGGCRHGHGSVMIYACRVRYHTPATCRAGLDSLRGWAFESKTTFEPPDSMMIVLVGGVMTRHINMTR